MASRYAVTTHDRCSRPPRSPTIVGSAVETIVWSSAASSMTSISALMTTRTRPRFSLTAPTLSGALLGQAQELHRHDRAWRPVAVEVHAVGELGDDRQADPRSRAVEPRLEPGAVVRDDDLQPVWVEQRRRDENAPWLGLEVAVDDRVAHRLGDREGDGVTRPPGRADRKSELGHRVADGRQRPWARVAGLVHGVCAGIAVRNHDIAFVIAGRRFAQAPAWMCLRLSLRLPAR